MLFGDVVGPDLVRNEADQPLQWIVVVLDPIGEVPPKRVPDVRGLRASRAGREALQRPLARLVEIDLLAADTLPDTSSTLC